MTIAHQNIQGFSGKDLQVNLCLEENSIDVLCLSETWIKDHEIRVFNTFRDYDIVSSNHRVSFNRGGTLIMVKRKINAKNRPDIVNISAEKDFEVSCVECDKCVILSVYRSPSGNLNIFKEKLEECLTKISHNNSKGIILCGDFNINFALNLLIINPLSDILDSYLLKQQFLELTRVTSQSGTCIDNIFTDETVVKKYKLNCIKSDHFGQLIIIKTFQTTLDANNKIIRRNLNAHNISKVKEVLTNIMNHDESINYDTFLRNVLLQLESHLPLKSRTKRKKKVLTIGPHQL